MATVLSEPLPKVSIIIPCKHIDNYTEQCIRHIKELDYSDFETIVLPDEDCKKIDCIHWQCPSRQKKEHRGYKFIRRSSGFYR